MKLFANILSEGVSSFFLHVLAMILMLGDHLWATLLPHLSILTWLGRIAFPIFAFLIVEGYFHTHDFRKYLLRLFIFALISEVPFNLITGGGIFYPFHQNVLFTFILGLLAIRFLDNCRQKGNIYLYILSCILISVLSLLIGSILMVDYFGVGVLLVVVFYIFHKPSWYNRLFTFAITFYLFVEILGGYYYPINIFGLEIELYEQAFGLLAFIPIWLYKGRQGYHEKWFQWFCYGFYPGHLLIIYLIWQLLI